MTDIVLLDNERIDDINESLKIIQKKQGLTFGSDTYLLAAFIKEQKYADSDLRGQLLLPERLI